LQSFSKLSAAQLLERYDLAQYQAVLLRAVRVHACVRFTSPVDYRQLFRTLKFRRLLHTIQKDGSGYQIDIDGPFSLFDSVTKYGLQLAMVFPALLRATHLELVADLRWGKTRETLSFRYDHERAEPDAALDPGVPDEVDALVAAFKKLKSEWKVAPSDQVFDLPGVGVVIPDLVFTQGKQSVYLEVMGFWSRDAVWKRVELVEAGLPQKMLFAVGQRLRVSEAALPDDAPSALLVYKGTLSARAVLAKLSDVAGR
jgi:predicted nuclease of restriction endonuclease-like RecB superfamily